MEKDLNTWEEFEKEYRNLEELRETTKKQTSLGLSELLYRGHANSQWHLDTTLERLVAPNVSLLKYYKLVSAAKSGVETFIDKSWVIPTLDEYKMWLDEQDGLFFFNFKAYDYFAYLRHHGFPSPLLDWTASPYLAAFFAFDKVERSIEKVSVYIYWEYAGGGKSSSSDEPSIHGLGPYAKVHRRHFLQQSRYTICTAIKDNKITYANHEDVLAKNASSQDRLWKFNLPVSERNKVMRVLDKMNINSYSLFGTEDSLVDTIASREIFVHGRIL